MSEATRGEVVRVGANAAVALANKNARILWAILTRGGRFDANHVPIQPHGPDINHATAPALACSQQPLSAHGVLELESL